MSIGMNAYNKDAYNPLYEENYNKIDWKAKPKEKKEEEISEEDRLIRNILLNIG